jgi:hypothetical protein
MDGPIKAAPRPSLGSNQQIAWEVLDEPLRNSIHYGKTKAAGSRPCTKYDAAVDLVAQRTTTDRNHQKSSAKTATTGLVNKKFLGMEGDWLWDALYTPPAPVPFPDFPPF